MVNLTELHRCVMEVRSIVESYAETVWRNITDKQTKSGASPEVPSTTLVGPLIVVIMDQYSNPVEIPQS